MAHEAVAMPAAGADQWQRGRRRLASGGRRGGRARCGAGGGRRVGITDDLTRQVECEHKR